MKVNLRCFSSLAADGACNFSDGTVYSLKAGQTIEDLARQAGIPRKNVKIAFVNSRKAELNTVLSDGDRVGLAPAVGGM